MEKYTKTGLSIDPHREKITDDYPPLPRPRPVFTCPALTLVRGHNREVDFQGRPTGALSETVHWPLCIFNSSAGDGNSPLGTVCSKIECPYGQLDL